MQLHRVHNKPEWESVPANNRNAWQGIAARTDGVLTIGNALTMLGVVLGLIGLYRLQQHSYWAALTFIGIGRLLDIADGYAADATGTKSPLGESLDAGFDKLMTVLTLVVFFIAGISPAYVLAAVLLPHMIIAAMGARALARGKRLHPSRLGKLSMAAAWVGLVGLVLAKALSSAAFMAPASYIVLGTSVLLGVVAIVDYARQG